jgi:hypothetical protein
MKTKITLLAIFGLFTTMANATDLYVRDLGAGGAFSTISAAIAQASDGDRIIIRPKSGSLPYVENLSVDKSLSFVSEINFSKYILQGTVAVVPEPGRTVTFHNLQISGTGAISVPEPTAGGRTTLNLFNCTTAAVNTMQSNTTLCMSGCTSAAVALTHGRITANKVSSILVNSSTVDTNPAYDPVEIIANVINASNAAFGMNQTNYALKFYNNYLTNGYVDIYAVKTNSNNEIANNVIMSSTGNFNTYSSISLNLPSTNPAIFSIVNNVLIYTVSSYAGYRPVYITAPGASAYVYYNVCNSNQYVGSFSTTGLAAAGNNTSSPNLTWNTTNFTVSGTSVVNAGSPEDDYADIDLSINDRGNAGGSNGWANYWPTTVGNKPQVNYLNTPRRIYNGTEEMNAQGSGYSK